MTRRELVWLHDIAGDQVDAIGHGFFDLWTDDRLDQSETMGFEIAADNPKAYRLAPDIDIVHRSRRFYISEIEERRQGRKTTVSVEANASWYRLGDPVYVGSLLISENTPAAGLAALLEGTGWTVGSATSTSSTTFSMEAQDATRLAMLRTWAKITGRFLVFDTVAQRVDLVDTRGAALGLAFRYGRNITGVRRRVSPPKLTRLFPFGADDLTIAGVNSGIPYLDDLSFYTDQGLTSEEAAARYTRSRVFVDASILREADLLAAAQVRLAAESGAQIAYELDVVDLSEVSAVTESARVGDTVGVHDPDFGDSVRPIVTRYRRSWLQPWRNKIELSTILDPISDGSSSARPSASEEWVQFVGPVRADYVIRNDGDYQVARIPLRFREGGRADFHLDLFGVGVGDGNAIVSVIDLADESAEQFRVLTIPYTDGNRWRAHMTWAGENISGSHIYAVKVTTEADGGASTTAGVDIAADTGADDITLPFEASWWIKAQGAVQETPSAENSELFEYVSDAPQQFTVPDNVTEVTVRIAGAKGGNGVDYAGGNGGEISFTMPVTPGAIFDVYCGNTGGGQTGGWPGGGDAEDFDGGGGGGLSAIVEAGGDLSNALAVAGAGGGGCERRAGQGAGLGGGGVGGFFNGGDGFGPVHEGGGGATQTAGGVPGADPGDAEAGSFLQGGRSKTSDAFQADGGGGGSGWYGGAGGVGYSNGASGGGGGSGIIRADVSYFGLLVSDGAHATSGEVEFSWESPLDQ